MSDFWDHVDQTAILLLLNNIIFPDTQFGKSNVHLLNDNILKTLTIGFDF